MSGNAPRQQRAFLGVVKFLLPNRRSVHCRPRTSWIAFRSIFYKLVGNSGSRGGSIMKSRLLRIAPIAAALAIVALAPVSAQQYPSQPIKIIVPNPAGGLPDTLSRIVGKRLQERIGQPVVVENRPGANSGIGTAALTGSAPDGYTFLMTDGAVF